MKLLLSAVAASLWIGAFAVAPGPANAYDFRNSSLPSYFSCGPYSQIGPFYCDNGDYSVYFTGRHLVAFAGMCAGGCSGSNSMEVDYQAPLGRHQVYDWSYCGGAYLLRVADCTSCS